MSIMVYHSLLHFFVLQRVLMFHYNGPTCPTANSCPPGLHYYFDYAMETKWEFATVSDILATSNSCAFRGNPGVSGKTFFGVNNFVTSPDQAAARTLNSYDFAKTRIEECSAIHGNLDVNMIFADFWSEGELPKLAQDHNTALAAARRRKLIRGMHN